MKLTRRFRLAAAFITLFCLLFMQLAIASYACPELRIADPIASTVDSTLSNHTAMPGCHGMDKKQPTLCHAHADTGNQSLDKADLPQVQPFIAVSLTLALKAIDVTSQQFLVIPEANHTSHASAPPLAIRNCCFRL